MATETILRTCERCGNAFVPQSRPNRPRPQRFCSAACRVTACKPVPQVCQRCGVAFITKNRCRQQYCSRACCYLTVEDRFWSKVEKTETCWLWHGTKGHFGHGRFTIGMLPYHQAHRLAWEWANGPIPDGLFICHHCDVACCVRPSHLFIGSQADNMRDMIEKGRQARGERVHRARLTADQVRAIRASTDSERTLARAFGVTSTNIHHIRNRKNWRWLE